MAEVPSGLGSPSHTLVPAAAWGQRTMVVVPLIEGATSLRILQRTSEGAGRPPRVLFQTDDF
ncbi:hypothetical protein [Acuticoccus sp.]|uniref:hypothetical protein n=1 Tax=Acuticoccus sp. TaxID=1904378 RepID=UPI003B51EADF